VSITSSQRLLQNLHHNKLLFNQKNKQHSNKSSKKGKKNTLLNWATIIKIIAISAVALSLLGYGVATAIENTFGIPHQQVYDSTLDLLALSSYAIMAAISSLSEVLENQTLEESTYKMFITGTTITATLFALRSKIIRKLWIKICELLRKALHPSKIYAIRNWLILNRLFLLPLSLGAIPPVIWAVIASLFLMPAIIPFFGFNLANQHFQKWVVAPKYCMPIYSRQERLEYPNEIDVEIAKIDAEITKNSVLCLELWNDREPTGIVGRHIASTSSHVMLFDPDSGTVWREPLGQLSIRRTGPTRKELRDKILAAANQENGQGSENSK